jgi:SAM-dependent methyltransferase
MSTSRSFDRAAAYYDRTRPLPEAVATDGIQAILEQIGPRARRAHLLEVGAGTGRISIPLLERGLDLIGCDLSAKMLSRLREKSASARIVQADAVQLPFPSLSFDNVMTVHVLHLIPAWREALREFRRLLVPGGAYLNVRTWATAGVSLRDQIRGHWRRWLAAKGVQADLPGVRSQEELVRELLSMGGRVTEVEAVRYPVAFTLREELDRFGSRIYSDAWEIPDDIFEASMQELRAWVEREYGNLDEPREDVLRFAIDVVRFGP